MKCSRCQHDNPDDVKICVSCGALMIPVGVPAREGERVTEREGAPVAELSGVTAAVTTAVTDNPIAGGDQAAASGDAERAFACYEQAFAQESLRKVAVERMIQLAERLGDPVRLARSLATMSQLTTDPGEQADYLVRAARVTWRGREQPDKAARAYLAALELDPNRLEAFLELTQCLTETGDTQGLEAAYHLMIRKHSQREKPNPQLLTKLWRKLGALLAEQDRFSDAEVALKTAADFDQDDIKNHATLMELYLRWPEKRAGALASLEEMVQTEDDRDELILNLHLLAEQHLEHGDHDAAYCVCQLLCVLDAADERERGFFEKLKPRGFGVPDFDIDAATQVELVFPKTYRRALGRIFGLLALAIHDVLGNELSDFDVRPKDRLDPEKPLLFNRLIKAVSQIFDLEEPPEVYVKDGEVGNLGLVNGIFEPPGFVLRRELLSGRTPHELAFIVTKLLVLQKPEFYLPGIASIEDLQVFFYGATKFAKPDAPIQRTKHIDLIIREIEDLEDDQREALREQMRAFIDAGKVVVLEDFAHAVDAIANRFAFIICDDLATACALIRTETDPIGVLSAEARVDQLYRYAISSQYRALRKRLGLAISVSS